MATPAQILANRENAQLSTGPATAEGKSHSSQNALRHGLTARGLIVPLGMEDKFTVFEAGLRQHLVPTGPLQGLLFQRILECAWAVERCRCAEANLFAAAADQSIDPLLDLQNEAMYARIQKYARQNENSMLKMMRELGRIQTELQYRDEIHELTDEEVQDSEKYQRTPQSHSDVTSLKTSFAAAGLENRRKLQIEANGAKRVKKDITALALLDRIYPPPTSRLPIDPQNLDRAA